VLNIMLKTTPEYRDLIYIKNFPFRKSYRDMKYFFVGDSHETIRTKYKNALFDICRSVNKKGIEHFIWQLRQNAYVFLYIRITLFNTFLPCQTFPPFLSFRYPWGTSGRVRLFFFRQVFTFALHIKYAFIF